MRYRITHDMFVIPLNTYSTRSMNQKSIVDNNLLMEIMEAREEVDNASTDEELRPLLQSCQKQQTELCNEIAKSFQEESIDLDAAKYQVAKLQYLNRIEETIMEKISSVH